jgi:hypothetical protein
MRRRNVIFKDWTEDYFVIKVGKRVVNKRGEIGFTSDRKHDSYATQFFLNEALGFAATEHRSQAFTEVHIHSDNAGRAR